MKLVKIIAVAATMVAGVSAANAATSDIDVLTGAAALQTASSATVLTVNPTEAKLIAIDNSVESVRALIQNNRFLLQNIERQGFTVDQIVGVSGTETGLTLYAL